MTPSQAITIIEELRQSTERVLRAVEKVKQECDNHREIMGEFLPIGAAPAFKELQMANEARCKLRVKYGV